MFHRHNNPRREGYGGKVSIQDSLDTEQSGDTNYFKVPKITSHCIRVL